MTDSTAKPVGNGNLKPFKKGYDPRRWLSGRGKKSPEQREGDEILRTVIWEELSREFDTASMKPLENPDTVDALRLMVRTWIKKNPAAVAERIAGKVTEKMELTGKDGDPLIEKVDDERFNRAISTLADAVRTSLSGTSDKQDGGMGSAK